MAGYLGEQEGTLLLDLPSEPIWVHSSTDLLRIVLKQLVRNGVQHNNSKKPIVEISCELNAAAARISVKDNGPGIPPAYLDQIFQPFKTLQNKSVLKSAGMGLALCKQVLDKFETEMGVETSSNSPGTRFYFDTPIYTELQT